MKKQAVVIGSVLAAVCFFISTPVFAAQQYPHKSGSVSGNVAVYYTIEYRGVQVTENDNSEADANAHLVFHVAYTLRNTSSKIQVANTTNFRLTVQGFTFNDNSSTPPNRLYYRAIYIDNALNCDVNDLNYNDASSNTTNEFYMNLFPTFSLVLEPEDKVSFSFDVCIPFATGSPYTPAIGQETGISFLSKTSWSSSVWNFTDNPTFTGFTVEEYANQKEGFWPYLIRALQRLVNGNQTPYQDSDVVDQGQTVTDNSQAAEQDLNDLHQSETGFYDDADDAIEQVDFASFQYDSSTTGGLNWFNDRFTDIWNNLGFFSVVPVFSMLLSLAVMILRHEVSRHG